MNRPVLKLGLLWTVMFAISEAAVTLISYPAHFVLFVTHFVAALWFIRQLAGGGQTESKGE